MRQKGHTSWLDVGVAEDGTYTIRDHNRLEDIIRELKAPDSQYPLLSVFLGGSTKDSALQALFSQNNIRRARAAASIYLRYDTLSAESTAPILFADGNLELARSSPDPTIQRTFETQISWNAASARDVLWIVYARLVFLFADIICIFADDFPNLSDVAQFLVDCAHARSASSLPIAVRPRVIVALAANMESPVGDVLKTEQFYQQLRGTSATSMLESFSSINMIHLAGNRLSEHARYERLRALIIGQQDDMQAVRRDHYALYNALHLGALFQSAVKHLAKTIQQPFNLIKATREKRIVPPGLSNHLAHYQEIGAKAGCGSQALISSIASAMLMDQYVPGMLGMESSPRLYQRQKKGKPDFTNKRLYSVISDGTSSRFSNSIPWSRDPCTAEASSDQSHIAPNRNCRYDRTRIRRTILYPRAERAVLYRLSTGATYIV
jgi:hypothetical protein